jgi:hypothetical protein
VNNNSRFYLPVENVAYVTIYRPVGPTMGSADIYLDGQLWGKMPNFSDTTQYSVPYSVGPIPSGAHILELRQTSPTLRYGVDRVTCQSMGTLIAGYYENDDLTLSTAYTGAWRKVNDVNASGGNLHRSISRGDRLDAVFDGNMLTLYRRTSLEGGVMTAYVDGQAYPINNYTRRTVNRVPHTILLPQRGIHTLELVAGSGYADFDAIEIGNAVPATFGAYQESHPQVIVNDVNLWTSVNAPANSEGKYIMTTQRFASIFFLFEGRRVTAYMNKGRSWGKVKVLLDTKVVGEIDLYQYDRTRPSIREFPFFAYDLPNLDVGTHVLELRFEGRYGLGLPQTNFDVVSVDGAPVPRPDQPTPPSEPDTGGGGEELLNVPREGCFEDSSREWTRIPAEGDGMWDSTQFPESSGGYISFSQLSAPPVDDVYAEFDFAAAGFGLLYMKGPNGGIAQIYLDDMNTPLIPSFNMYSSTYEFLDQALYSVSGLDPNVIHLLRIKHTGLAGGPGGGSEIYIDRIDLPAYDENFNDQCWAIPEG